MSGLGSSARVRSGTVIITRWALYRQRRYSRVSVPVGLKPYVSSLSLALQVMLYIFVNVISTHISIFAVYRHAYRYNCTLLTSENLGTTECM